MERETIDFGTFFTEYLERHFPDRARDSELIETRRCQAQEAYRKAYGSGMTYEQSMQKAMDTLLSDFLFSPYSLLEEAIDERFGYTLTGTEKEKLCERLMVKLSPLFENYTITDEFIRSKAYPLLVRELAEALGKTLADEAIGFNDPQNRDR